ncbi:hypothetical protein GZ77_11495 [Endozoicomonas montiporae]|uniref:Uncharacterized protein n=2 Tax=Endozoicomonas montiporae TaxID=1027273 RepID=A0A081N8V8_9GAMM|nr:hypothetical protein [Endozoicomonas montiporae]AMO55200.1 hypothetical protein EZMO1_0986 [Endozoicomonas montiporae CL-33]KEQ14881.1 hypothetical protein GZ77_11495 [Endozoicomonas montiporae]
MTDSINGNGPVSGNWLKQTYNKAKESLKGFLHFGKVSKTSGKSHIKVARFDNANKPETTPVQKRKVQHTRSSELPSIRVPDSPSTSSPAKTLTLPLLEIDPLHEAMHEAQMELMDMQDRWNTLYSKVVEKTTEKKELGIQLNAAIKKTGLPREQALKLPKLARAKNNFARAVNEGKTAKLNLAMHDKIMETMQIAIDRLHAAENLQAERELKQLMAGG